MAAAEYAAEACPKPFELSHAVARYAQAERTKLPCTGVLDSVRDGSSLKITPELAQKTEQEIDAEKAFKPRVDLIPGHALLEVGRTMAYGFGKHGTCTWRTAGTEQAKASTHVASASRHLAEYLGDPDATEEGSGLSVLAHCAAQLLIAIECRRRELADVPVYDANAMQITFKDESGKVTASTSTSVTKPRSIAYVATTHTAALIAEKPIPGTSKFAFAEDDHALRGTAYDQVVLVDPDKLSDQTKRDARGAARSGVREVWTSHSVVYVAENDDDARAGLILDWDWNQNLGSKQHHTHTSWQELRGRSFHEVVLVNPEDLDGALKASAYDAARLGPRIVRAIWTPLELDGSEEVVRADSKRPLTYKGWDVIPTSSGCAVREQGGQLIAFSCLPEAVKFIRKA